MNPVRYNRTSMIVSYTPARRGLLLVNLLGIPFFANAADL